MHLALDLSDAGARRGAWTGPGPRADRHFRPAELLTLVAAARRGALDLVVLDEQFTVHPTRRPGSRGLDPALVAGRLGPATNGIGLVPTLTADGAHVQVARAVAAVDQATQGRAGWQVGPGDVAVRDVPDVTRWWERWHDGGAAQVEGLTEPDRPVVREGVRFAPSDPPGLPGPVQVHPPVVVRAASPEDLAEAGRVADVVRVAAAYPGTAARHRARVRAGAVSAGRHPDQVRVLVDAYVVLAADRMTAQTRLDLVAQAEGPCWDDDTLVHAGPPGELATLMADWVRAGATDGFTVRPSSLRSDVDAFVDAVVPDLQDLGLHRRAYPGRTLRETLGLPVSRPVPTTA